MKSNIKKYWLLLVVVALTTMLLPVHIIAQDAQRDLTIRLAYSSYRDELTRGEDNIFYLDVINNSSEAITGIQFNADGPKDWFIEFKPQSIGSLNADSIQTVDVIVRPPESTSRGNYNITLTARTAETMAVTNIFVRVERGTSIWMWIGIIIVVVVIGGFVIVFMRFGRQ